MIRGLYSSTAGMDVQQARVESISNNLANAATPGYKKETVRTGSFPELLLVQHGGPDSKKEPVSRPKTIGAINNGALVADVSVNYDQGLIQETGNFSDILIKGPGFFAVSAPSPEDPARVCYTRNGAFKVDPEGYLVTSSGYRVLGEAGEIQSGSEEFNISPDGTIESKGNVLDRLRLVEFDDLAGLRKEADGIFVDLQSEARPAAVTAVSQGYLEKSNVNVVDEMADLIATARTYEVNQKLIQAHDELLAKAANQVGSLR